MKHKTVWTCILWMIIFGIFELPLWTFDFEKLIGANNIAFIFLIDLYVTASLFALLIAITVTQKIEDIRKIIKEES